MFSRKKRVRYVGFAKAIAVQHGLPEPMGWEAVWELLEKYGEPTFVYAVVDRESAVVKFGRSVNPGQRLKALKTGNALNLALWAYCVETPDLCERSIHKQCDASRLGGEWFRLNPETQAVIDQMRAKAGVIA